MPNCNLSSLALLLSLPFSGELANADRWVCMDAFLDRTSISRKAKVTGLNAEGNLLVAEPNGDLFIVRASRKDDTPPVSYFGHIDLNPGERIAGFNPMGHIVVVNATGDIQMVSETVEQAGVRWRYGNVPLARGEYIAGVSPGNQILVADRAGNFFQITHVRIPGLRFSGGKVDLDHGQRIIGQTSKGHAVVADGQGNVFLYDLDPKGDGQLRSYATIEGIASR